MEKYFRAQWIESKQFSAIGSYWDRRSENEIDIVAINDYEKRVIIAEVKRQAKNINLNMLRTKATHLTAKLPEYEIVFKGLSMDDM